MAKFRKKKPVEVEAVPYDYGYHTSVGGVSTFVHRWEWRRVTHPDGHTEVIPESEFEATYEPVDYVAGVDPAKPGGDVSVGGANGETLTSEMIRDAVKHLEVTRPPLVLAEESKSPITDAMTLDAKRIRFPTEEKV